MAARIAQNMTASLSVPTATSVRAMPTKLLIDNRIVINNHPPRPWRQGVVHPPDRLCGDPRAGPGPGDELPYAEADGKPVLVQPEHINLAGHRHPQAATDPPLLVPNIKAAEAMDFRQFWMAYEDVVRKARSGKLTVDDFAGTTISLTNPGTIGTEHPAAADARPGPIVGVGAEYPAAYQGASARPWLAGDRQDHHADLHLRPPDHPGAQSGDFLRLIHRLLSARTRSTTACSARCGSRTSRSAGSRTSRPATRTT
jgi:2-oxoglutarate dehydrogenase E1 component